MTKQDRQKLSILLVLLAVFGLTAVLGYRMYEPSTTASRQPAPEAKTSANPPAPSDARIRLDLVEKPEGSEEDIGKKNVFQYRQASLSAAATKPSSQPGASLPATDPVVIPVPPGPPPGPVTPPPPPPISLKYQGYAASRSGLTAFLSDEQRHYNVIVGEVLMGRFQVTQISDKSVEVEDLQYSRKQTLPLLK